MSRKCEWSLLVAWCVMVLLVIGFVVNYNNREMAQEKVRMATIMDYSDSAISDLKQDEGFRAFKYQDIKGIYTVGHGTELPLTDVDLASCFGGLSENTVLVGGLTLIGADCLLRTRLTRYVNEFKAQWTSFVGQPQVVKDSLSNMVYNLGVHELLKFDTMLLFLSERKYIAAADDALKTAWARELPARAHRITERIRSVGG